MKLFLKNITIFFSSILIIALIFRLVGGPYFPAPKITNSYSFNEKLRVLPPFNEKVNILAIGSSMTLNNLMSEVIIEEFNDSSFFNAGVWGITINHLYDYVKILTEIYNPEIVICAGNIQDFYFSNFGSLEFDSSELTFYIRHRNIGSVYLYLNNLDVFYYVEKYKENKINFETNNLLSTLNFDIYGGAFLIKDKQYIPPKKRYNDTLKFYEANTISYSYFDSISTLLKDNDIKFYYMQCPIRSGLVDSHYQAEISEHKEKISAILKTNEHFFIDATHYEWSDQFFLDNTHLDSTASVRLTKLIKKAN